MNASLKILKTRQTLDSVLPYLDTGVICNYSFFLSKKVEKAREAKIKEQISLNLDAILHRNYVKD